jgi:hypothetical protein
MSDQNDSPKESPKPLTYFNFTNALTWATLVLREVATPEEYDDAMRRLAIVGEANVNEGNGPKTVHELVDPVDRPLGARASALLRDALDNMEKVYSKYRPE